MCSSSPGGGSSVNGILAMKRPTALLILLYIAERGRRFETMDDVYGTSHRRTVSSVIFRDWP
jgi:hypothetical protein